MGWSGLRRVLEGLIELPVQGAELGYMVRGGSSSVDLVRLEGDSDSGDFGKGKGRFQAAFARVSEWFSVRDVVVLVLGMPVRGAH